MKYFLKEISKLTSACIEAMKNVLHSLWNKNNVYGENINKLVIIEENVV